MGMVETSPRHLCLLYYLPLPPAIPAPQPGVRGLTKVHRGSRAWAHHSDPQEMP